MCGLLSEHEKNKYSFTTLCWGCPLQLLFDKFSAKMYSWGFRNPLFHILGPHSQHPSPSWGFLASDTSALENLRLSQFHANYLICKSTLSKKSYKMMWLWSRYVQDISRGIISRQKSGQVGSRSRLGRPPRLFKQSRSRSGRPPRLISPIPGT